MRAAIAAALLSAAAAYPAAAAEPAGLWTVPGSGFELRIQPCGGALCGVLVNSNRLKTNPGARDEKNKNPALRTRLLKGVTMLEGFQGGPPAWKGSVYLPGNGETYRATMTVVDPKTLSLKVCLSGPLCRTQTLKRMD